jgi:hypothetical protein
VLKGPLDLISNVGLSSPERNTLTVFVGKSSVPKVEYTTL